MQRIAIIGLGLIGGSLGIALKRSSHSETEIIGYDKDADALTYAIEHQVVDRYESKLDKAVSDADLVVLSTPVTTMQSVMKELSPSLKKGSVVTDTGSTKSQVMSWAEDLLPLNVDFVGGHPMAGKEVSGIENADPGLFKGSVYCITPSPSASGRAKDVVADMARKVGATPLVIEAEKHDDLVAAVSHLPMIVSSALVSVATSSTFWEEISTLASSGFRDTTRLASSDPKMSIDIYRTNQNSIGQWIDALIRELESYRALIVGDGEGLQQKIADIKKTRDRWVRQREEARNGSLAPQGGIPVRKSQR